MPNVNLAALPAHEQQAIEQDKQRWIEANNITDTKSPDEIRRWLLRQSDDDYREDMRQRLNTIHRNRLHMENNDASASSSKRTG